MTIKYNGIAFHVGPEGDVEDIEIYDKETAEAWAGEHDISPPELLGEGDILITEVPEEVLDIAMVMNLEYEPLNDLKDAFGTEMDWSEDEEVFL